MSNHPPEGTVVLIKTSHFFVSRLTPAQVGALGVIGILGGDAELILAAYFDAYSKSSIQSLDVGSIVAGDWHHAIVVSQSASDTPEGRVPQRHEKPECVVLVKTGIEAWEIHVHGGQAVTKSLLKTFVLAGAAEIPWNEWFACNGSSYRNNVIRGQLARVDGFYAAQILTRQLSGYFQRDIKQIQQFIRKSEKSQDNLKGAQTVINRLQRSARVGMRLAEPWKVILLGPVNAGKSSLLNALAGYARSIVSPHAGTTRDVLATRVVLNGWAVDLTDTAGFRPVNDSQQLAPSIEKEGIERAMEAARSADLILNVRSINELEKERFSVEKVGKDYPPCIDVGTKADLSDNKQSIGKSLSAGLIMTSARTGEGLDELVKVIVETLMPEAREPTDCFVGGVPITSEDLDVVKDLHKKIEIYSRDL